MSKFGVSRTTVRKAIGLLREDGFIDARQGRGTEVRAAPRREDSYNFTSLLGDTTIESRLARSTDSVIVAQAATVETVSAPDRVAAALGLDARAQVQLVQRLKIVDDEPIAHIASYLDATAFPDLVNHSGQLYYLYQFLATNYGTRFRRSQSKLTAVAADFIESRVLDVPVGTPLVLHTRVTESETGPIEYAESFERPDRLATYVTITPSEEQRDSFLSYEL
jgi:GntR family transcriptional regulator